MSTCREQKIRRNAAQWSNGEQEAEEAKTHSNTGAPAAADGGSADEDGGSDDDGDDAGGPGAGGSARSGNRRLSAPRCSIVSQANVCATPSRLAQATNSKKGI